MLKYNFNINMINYSKRPKSFGYLLLSVFESRSKILKFFEGNLFQIVARSGFVSITLILRHLLTR